jgi:hypothetical protein
MIYFDDIYDNVLKPAGIKYYVDGSSIKKLPERNNRTNEPLIWMLMYPKKFRVKFAKQQDDGIDINQTYLSHIKKGTLNKKKKGEIKEYFDPRPGEGLDEMYQHINNLIDYAAEVTILIENKYHKDKEAFSKKEATQIKKVHEGYESVRESYVEKITENLRSSFESIISDTNPNLAEDIRNIVFNAPIKGLSLLCTLAMLNENVSLGKDKKFDTIYLVNVVKYINEMRDDYDISLIDKVIDTTNKLVDSCKLRNNIEIDEDLLPQCNSYPNLYECIDQTLNHKNKKNYYLQAVGGNGKTCSLLYLCKELIRKNNPAIPFFVEMKYVDSSADYPIKKYIFSKCTESSNNENDRFQSVFWDSLYDELEKNEKKLMLILDGCNESHTDCIKDLSYFLNQHNTVIVMSSRLSNQNPTGFRSLELCSLKKNNVEHYLKKHNVKYTVDYKNNRLMLPMFVKMIADFGDEINVDCNGTSSGISQAEIIENWVKWDIKHNSELTNQFDKRTEFSLTCYLPLMALYIYDQSNVKDHTSLMISQHQYDSARREVKKILEDEEFSSAIYALNGWNITKLNLSDCWNNIIVDGFAYLQRTDDKAFSFSWTHECYRDWFVAKGYDVLRRYAPQLFFEKVNTFVCNQFKYPEVFEQKDYPTYYTALYLAEMIGESELIAINDSVIHSLIRNIIYFADDLGDYKMVKYYTGILSDRENNRNLSIPYYQRANALCGTACANLHIPAFANRKEYKKLAKAAKDMLDGSKNYLESIIEGSFDRVLDSKIKTLYKNTPVQTVKLFETNIKKKPFTKLEDIYVDSDKSEYDKYTILACLSRVYSNYWSYYIHNYTLLNDEENLTNAFESIVLSGLIKYYNWKEKPDEVISGKSTQELLAHTFQSIGITLFHAGLYSDSISYFEYLLDNFHVSDDLSAIISSFMIRSKIFAMKSGQLEVELPELISDEKEVVKYFSDNKMLGRLEKTADIVAELITLYNAGQRDITTGKKLNDLQKYIENQFDKYFIDDDLKKKMEMAWNMEPDYSVNISHKSKR